MLGESLSVRYPTSAGTIRLICETVNGGMTYPVFWGSRTYARPGADSLCIGGNALSESSTRLDMSWFHLEVALHAAPKYGGWSGEGIRLALAG